MSSSTNHRKRHAPPGPCGLWFQTQQQLKTGGVVNNASTNQKEDDDDETTRPQISPSTTTSPSKTMEDLSFSPAWTAMQLELTLCTPCLPLHWDNDQRYQELKKHYHPSHFRLLPDILYDKNLSSSSHQNSDRAPFSMHDDRCRLLVLVQSVESHIHHNIWTVELRDETGMSLKAWMEPKFVQEDMACQRGGSADESSIRPGVVWMLNKVVWMIVPPAPHANNDENNDDDDDDRGLERILMISGKHIEQIWLPEQQQQEEPRSSATSPTRRHGTSNNTLADGFTQEPGSPSPQSSDQLFLAWMEQRKALSSNIQQQQDDGNDDEQEEEAMQAQMEQEEAEQDLERQQQRRSMGLDDEEEGEETPPLPSSFDSNSVFPRPQESTHHTSPPTRRQEDQKEQTHALSTHQPSSTSTDREKNATNTMSVKPQHTGPNLSSQPTVLQGDVISPYDFSCFSSSASTQERQSEEAREVETSQHPHCSVATSTLQTESSFGSSCPNPQASLQPTDTQGTTASMDSTQEGVSDENIFAMPPPRAGSRSQQTTQDVFQSIHSMEDLPLTQSQQYQQMLNKKKREPSNAPGNPLHLDRNGPCLPPSRPSFTAPDSTTQYCTQQSEVLGDNPTTPRASQTTKRSPKLEGRSSRSNRKRKSPTRQGKRIKTPPSSCSPPPPTSSSLWKSQSSVHPTALALLLDEAENDSVKGNQSWKKRCKNPIASPSLKMKTMTTSDNHLSSIGPSLLFSFSKTATTYDFSIFSDG